MCKVSDKIKFCTCSAADASSLKHYWILHRFIEGKATYFIGEIMPSYDIESGINKFNKALLRKRVNETDAFDIDLQPKEEDRLQITFTCKDEEGEKPLTYGFEFRNDKWVPKEYRTFEWENHHNATLKGKIESPLIDSE